MRPCTSPILLSVVDVPIWVGRWNVRIVKGSVDLVVQFEFICCQLTTLSTDVAMVEFVCGHWLESEEKRSGELYLVCISYMISNAWVLSRLFG